MRGRLPRCKEPRLDPNAQKPEAVMTFDEKSQWRGAGRDIVLTWGDMGLLTDPHQTSFSEPSSLTTRLSSGDRPVFAPEYAVKAPVEVMAEPVS